jgi:hypothetical protein
MKYTIIVISVLSILLISCTHSPKEPSYTRTQEQVPSNVPAPAVSQNTSADSTDGSIQQPESDAPTAEIILNPPHGEPGHSCDIPVGSPLNALADNPVREVRNTSLAPTIENAARMGSPNRRQSSPAPASSGTARLNPPHGQPGHRCEIPVGSPLN